MKSATIIRKLISNLVNNEVSHYPYVYETQPHTIQLSGEISPEMKLPYRMVAFGVGEIHYLFGLDLEKTNLVLIYSSEQNPSRNGGDNPIRIKEINKDFSPYQVLVHYKYTRPSEYGFTLFSSVNLASFIAKADIERWDSWLQQ